MLNDGGEMVLPFDIESGRKGPGHVVRLGPLGVYCRLAATLHQSIVPIGGADNVQGSRS